MFCAKCGARVKVTDNFCGACGSPVHFAHLTNQLPTSTSALSVPCSVCGTRRKSVEKYCQRCGTMYPDNTYKRPSYSDASVALSPAEKELLLVQRVSIRDMNDLENMPFVWNTQIKKYTNPGAHPFAYMDIIGSNIDIVRNEITKVNMQITRDTSSRHDIPLYARIPVNDLVFLPNGDFGYTRLICSPKTITGKIAKYPLKLLFMTDLSRFDNETHGEIVYGKDGKIKKANIYFWQYGRGHLLYYKTVNGDLVLDTINNVG